MNVNLQSRTHLKEKAVLIDNQEKVLNKLSIRVEELLIGRLYVKKFKIKVAAVRATASAPKKKTYKYGL